MKPLIAFLFLCFCSQSGWSKSTPSLVCDGAAKEIRAGLIYQTTSTLRGGSEVFIYVIKSSADEVLLVGMGWGNPSTGADWARQSDAKRYLMLEVENDSAFEAKRVHQVITNSRCLNMKAGSISVSFIVPHAHFDHLNAEMPGALQALGYQIDRIYIHENDSYLLCDAFYCNTNPLRLMLFNSRYVSAPFFPSIASLKTRFEFYGSGVDTCSTVSLRLPYAGGGEIRAKLMSAVQPGRKWVAGKDFHTEGAVNLFIDSEKIVLVGASPTNSNCSTTDSYFPPNVKTYCQHSYSCTGNSYPPEEN